MGICHVFNLQAITMLRSVFFLLIGISVTEGRQYRLTSFCDHIIKVYLDGVLVGSASWQSPNPETGVLTINIDPNTRVVGIECYDEDGSEAGGTIASLSTGLVTDESWVCSAQYVENWEQPGFQATGSLWTSARQLSGAWWSTSHDMSPWATYIWTPNTGDRYGYCRRDLDIETSLTCPGCDKTGASEFQIQTAPGLVGPPLRQLSGITRRICVMECGQTMCEAVSFENTTGSCILYSWAAEIDKTSLAASDTLQIYTVVACNSDPAAYPEGLQVTDTTMPACPVSCSGTYTRLATLHHQRPVYKLNNGDRFLKMDRTICRWVVEDSNGVVHGVSPVPSTDCDPGLIFTSI